MNHDKKLQEYIDALVIWAFEKGYYVIFDRNGDDSICRESKIISIKNTRSLETQLYTLLHECGHLLIYNNNSVFEYERVEGSYGEKTMTRKSFRVIEEVEAWKRGKTLASRLGITINEKKWDREVSSAINKYMKWAVS